MSGSKSGFYTWLYFQVTLHKARNLLKLSSLRWFCSVTTCKEQSRSEREKLHEIWRYEGTKYWPKFSQRHALQNNEIPTLWCRQIPACLLSSWFCDQLFFLTTGPADPTGSPPAQRPQPPMDFSPSLQWSLQRLDMPVTCLRFTVPFRSLLHSFLTIEQGLIPKINPLCSNMYSGSAALTES